MTTFSITHKLLSSLFELNQFQIPADCTILFVGLRGCVPADTSDNAFKAQVDVSLREIDYKNLRCTLLQWNVADQTIAAFAGSTVPSYNNIIGFRKKPPRNSNCITPGFYKSYRKGKHRPANTRNWHDAFRQDGQPLAIRRTYDNTVYDNFDEITTSTGCDDNIHAAWTLDEDSGYFSSAGCQVIMGIPFCDSTRASQNDNRGPWKVFKENGYSAQQPLFPYALLNASEAYKVAINSGKELNLRLKYGSSGDWVKAIQEKLIALNFLSGTADGDYGTNTFNAVKRFQEEQFGIDAVDCVVGPVTASVLGVPTKTITIP